VISHDFESLIHRLLNQGLDARFVQIGLDGAIPVLDCESESSGGVFADFRVLCVT
jgi:hypothetical protein